MPITDNQQAALAELGDNPIQASLNKHRTNLDKTSSKALNKLTEALDTDTATVDQTAKIYDITRKHLNVLDGRSDGTAQNIIIMPSEFTNQTQQAIEGEVLAQLALEKETHDKE